MPEPIKHSPWDQFDKADRVLLGKFLWQMDEVAINKAFREAELKDGRDRKTSPWIVQEIEKGSRLALSAMIEYGAALVLKRAGTAVPIAIRHPGKVLWVFSWGGDKHKQHCLAELAGQIQAVVEDHLGIPCFKSWTKVPANYTWVLAQGTFLNSLEWRDTRCRQCPDLLRCIAEGYQFHEETVA